MGAAITPLYGSSTSNQSIHCLLPQRLALLAEEEDPLSITQCTCGSDVESDYMIQCGRCQAWQHGECVGITESSCPENYLCYGCVKSNSELEASMSGALCSARPCIQAS